MRSTTRVSASGWRELLALIVKAVAASRWHWRAFPISLHVWWYAFLRKVAIVFLGGGVSTVWIQHLVKASHTGLVVAGILALALAFGVSGCDWTQAGYDSAHTGFNPTENTISPSNVGRLTAEWVAGTDTGSTHASPVVADGNVFVGGDDGSLLVFAVSCATSGATCHPSWEGSYSGSALMSSPAVYGGYVYVTSDSSQGAPSVLAFPESGTGSTCTPGSPPTCAPVDESQLFEFAADSQPTSPPTVANGLAYFSSGPVPTDDVTFSELAGFNFATERAVGGVMAPVELSDIAVSHGLLYVEAGDDTLRAYSTSALSANAGIVAPVWSVSAPFDGLNGPVVDDADGIVFVPGGDGNLYAYSAATGALLWEGSIPASGPVASPAVANGVVYIGQANATAPATAKLYAFAATGCGASSCKPVWTGDTAGTHIGVSPTIANGVVYVGTDNGPGELDAFAATGCPSGSCNPLFTFTLPSGGVTTPATVANGAVYFGTDSASHGVYALTLSKAITAAARTNDAERKSASGSRSRPANASIRERQFSGSGPRRLGTITIRQPATLRWTVQGAPAQLSFKLVRDAHPLVVRSLAHSGQIAMPPNTYRDVRVTARGRWTIQIG
jgi:outer membrane protein assembly factor BamB